MANELQGLLNKFDSEVWQERNDAFQSLKELLSEKLVVYLISELQKRNSENFLYWSIKLTCLKPEVIVRNREKIVSVASGLLEKAEFDLARYFIPLLVIINDASSIPILIGLFMSPKWKIRNEVSENLVLMGEKVAPYLSKAFQGSREKDVQYWSMKVYGKVMGGKSIPSLSNAFKSSNYMIRYYSIIALGETGSIKAIPILIMALEDESFLVRTRAMEILESIGENSLSFLEVFFKKGNSNMKNSAIKLFARIRGEEGIKQIMDFTAENPDRSFYLISALSEVKTFKSMNLLIELLADPSWEVKKYTYDQLLRFGTYSVNFLKEYMSKNPDLDHEMYLWFAKIFACYPVLAKNELVFLLNMNDEEILNVVLDKMRPDRITKEIIETLIRYFNHEKWPVRKKVAMYIRKADELAVPFLNDYYSVCRDNDQKYWIERTLIYLGSTISSNVDESKNTMIDNREILTIHAERELEDLQKTKDPGELKLEILAKVDTVENLFLRKIILDIIDETDMRRRINLILLMNEYISKIDLSILLDLYRYYPDEQIRKALMDAMHPLITQDYVDIFVNLYKQEDKVNLKIKILHAIKTFETRSVIELAFDEYENGEERISYLAGFIIEKFNQSVNTTALMKEDEEEGRTARANLELETLFLQIRQGKTNMSIDEFLYKIENEENKACRIELVNFFKDFYFPQSRLEHLVSHSKTEARMEFDSIRKQNSFMYVISIAFLLIISVVEGVIIFSGRQTPASGSKVALSATGTIHASGNELTDPAIKEIIPDQYITEGFTCESGQYQIRNRKKVEIATNDKEQAAVLKKFYQDYCDAYNMKNTSRMKELYSEEYQDGKSTYQEITLKFDKEFALLGSARMKIIMNEVRNEGGRYLVTYCVYLEGRLKTGLDVDRDMTEMVLEDTLVLNDGKFRIISSSTKNL